MRSSSASARGSWLSLPGRCASTSASDWSANSGWRSHTVTISSIGIVSIHPASRASASRARAARHRLLDARGGADRDHAAVAAGVAQGGAQRQPAAQRVAAEHGALPRGGDLVEAPGQVVLAVVERARVDPIRQLLEQRRPRVAALHEAGNEDDRRHERIMPARPR